LRTSSKEKRNKKKKGTKMVDLNTSSPPAKSSPYVGTSAENSWGHVKDSWRATATAAPISISVSDIRPAGSASWRCTNNQNGSGTFRGHGKS